MKVLVATGMGSEFEKFIANTAKHCDYEVIPEYLDVRKFLLEKADQYQPQIVVLSDSLMSDLPLQQLQRDQELLQIIHELRVQEIRVIFIGIREAGDGFLAELINLQVFDIWHQKKFNQDDFQHYFFNENKKTYKDVMHLRMMSKGMNWSLPEPQEEKNESLTSKNSESNHEKSLTIPLPKININWFSILNSNSSKQIIKMPQYLNLQPKMIAITSLYPGAGASFLTGNLAKAINQYKVPVGILESIGPYPIWYEQLFGYKHAPKRWQSIAQQIKYQGHVDTDTLWKEDHIVWMPLEPDFSTKDWSIEDYFHLIMAARQIPILLVDISSHLESEMSKLVLNTADEIWMVVGNSPVKFNVNKPRLETLQNYFQKLFLIQNQWNDVARKSKYKKEWKEGLAFEDAGKICYHEILATISRYGEEVTQAEWEGKMLWDELTDKNHLHAELKPLIQKLIPEEIMDLDLSQEKSSIFKRIFTR